MDTGDNQQTYWQKEGQFEGKIVELYIGFSPTNICISAAAAMSTLA